MKIIPTKKEFKPLPIINDEDNAIQYLVKVADAKWEISPFDPEKKKHVVNVEFDVLNEEYKGRKIWFKYGETISLGGKRLSKLTQLILAADPTYTLGDLNGYDTNDLKGKVLKITLANKNKSSEDPERVARPEEDDEVYQSPDKHIRLREKAKAADPTDGTTKDAVPAIAGVATSGGKPDF